jgi:16S rRNA (uracil1498-N3)-methyltransferase
MRLFFQPDILNGAYFLDSEESRHCVKVLRLKEQDQILVLDGNGGKHTVAIKEANYRKCSFEIIASEQALPPDHRIHIAIAPTKNIDRIEWFVEKAVELGVQEISFFFADNSERKHFKTDRVYKKAVSAMKQSLKTFLPIINSPIKLSELIAKVDNTERYIAYVDQDNPDLLFEQAAPNKAITILIGPEGDFSEKELKLATTNQFKKISLGESRLRTETAGIAACHILNLINGN